MTAQPKVSVIIPVYNSEKFLRVCLDSVLAQTLREIEIICVDDGSADSSPRILEEYARRDSRVTVVTQKNSGAGAARNAGLALARGEYLSFLDADDFFSPRMLEEAYARAAENRADLVLFSAKSYDNATKQVRDMPFTLRTNCLPQQIPFSAEDIAENIFEVTTPAPWNKLWRKNFTGGTKVKFQSVHNTNDVAFDMTCLALAKRIAYIDEALYYYRRGLTGNVQNTKNKFPRDFFSALLELRRNLVSHGVYDIFRKSFLRFAEMTCAFNFSGINYDRLSLSDRKQMCERLEVPFSVMEKKGKYRSVDPRSEFCIVTEGRCVPPRYSDTISLVVPVYNTEKYLPKCLDSLLCQSYERLEIICVDDGSTDGSREILRSYAQRDGRIRLVEKDKNEGSLLARADGTAAATGKYLMFIDSDDYLAFDACRQLMGLARLHPADVLQFTVGVEYYNDAQPSQYLKKVLAVARDEALTGDEFMRRMFLTREITIFLFGKLYKTETVKAAFAAMDAGGFYCYVGEDIFTSFFLGVCAESFAAVKTEALYYYSRGLGVSNNSCMPLPRFEQYCRMSELPQRVQAFLTKQGLLERYMLHCEAMATRMLEDCLRNCKYRLAQEDRTGGGKMLLQYWGASEKFDSVFEKFTGMTASEFALAHADVPIYEKKRRSEFAPKISVIIPVYNVKNYLEECLDSICGQTLKEIEIICVNDGSYDGSLSVLEKFYGSDDRITLISQKNAGVGAARNAALEYAAGKYIYFIDSDDWLERDALKTLYQKAERENLDALYFEAQPFAKQNLEVHAITFPTNYRYAAEYPGVFDGPALFERKILNNDYFVAVYLALLRAGFVRDNRLQFPSGILHEDVSFSFAVALRARRAAVLPRAFYHRRVRENSIMVSRCSFRNAYGYFICFLEMARTLRDSESGLPVSVYASACQKLMATLNNSQACYRQMPLEDRGFECALEDARRILFHALVARPAQIFEEKNKLHRKLQCAYKEKSEINAKLQRTYKEKSARGVQIKELRAEISRLRSSRSYRIGRAVTFVPRKIRGAVKCWRQHGAAYTFGRVLVHLGIKKEK